MKKVLCLILVALTMLCVGCKSDEEKMKKKYLAYCKENKQALLYFAQEHNGVNASEVEYEYIMFVQNKWNLMYMIYYIDKNGEIVGRTTLWNL